MSNYTEDILGNVSATLYEKPTFGCRWPATYTLVGLLVLYAWQRFFPLSTGDPDREGSLVCLLLPKFLLPRTNPNRRLPGGAHIVPPSEVGRSYNFLVEVALLSALVQYTVMLVSFIKTAGVYMHVGGEVYINHTGTRTVLLHHPHRLITAFHAINSVFVTAGTLAMRVAARGLWTPSKAATFHRRMGYPMVLLMAGQMVSGVILSFAHSQPLTVWFLAVFGSMGTVVSVLVVYFAMTHARVLHYMAAEAVFANSIFQAVVVDALIDIIDTTLPGHVHGPLFGIPMGSIAGFSFLACVFATDSLGIHSPVEKKRE